MSDLRIGLVFFVLRAIRLVAGVIAGFQVFGIILSVLIMPNGNPSPDILVQLGVKLIVAIFGFMVFFVTKKVINNINLRIYGEPHSIMQGRWNV